MWSKIKWIFIITVLCLALFAFTAFFCGCDSFKEVKPDVLSDYPECIVMMNAGEIYKGSDKDKSGTVLPVSECLNSIKRQRCAMEVFNKQIECNGKKIYVVDWDDEKGMYKFNDCMSKK